MRGLRPGLVTKACSWLVAATLLPGACGGSGSSDGSTGSSTTSPRTSPEATSNATAARDDVAVTSTIGDAPQVVEVSPADGSIDVDPHAEIRVRFDRPVDPATFSGDLQPNTTDFTVEWSDDDTLLTVLLDAPLDPDTTYFVAVDLAFDREGNALAGPVHACFSTGETLDCPTFECAGAGATDDVVPTAEEVDYAPPFAADSPWNTPIGEDPALAEGSDAMIDRLAETFAHYGGFWLGVLRNVVPVYLADESTPRHDIPLTSPNPGAGELFAQVPIPDGALADCGYDGWLVVVDLSAGTVYELHRARRAGDGWTAETGAATSLDGSGIHEGDGARSTTGVRASGSSLLAGLVWPHELAAGEIGHALAIGYEQISHAAPVAPFTATDGIADDDAAIPMGSRLQLDPSLDLGSLGLDAWERTIAVALQEYGAFLVDTAGGISLAALHVHSLAGNPWEGLLPDSAIAEEGVLLGNLPPGAFRVLAPGE